ncbi:MAG: c-type cytochrome [Nitrospina sp.]|jgi:mono/diheme cytochrome c family protein|nr:c-type cytochrome [Nitrospina sp.]
MKPKILYLKFALLVLAVLFPVSLVAQEHKMDHGAMDHSGGGQEYRAPMDHGDHGSMQHEDGVFRSRGSHDQAELSKPKDLDSKSLLARGRNIFMHMCVFCHGEDGNGGGQAVEYLYPWPRDFREGIFKFRSTPTGTLPRDEDLYRTIIEGIPGTSMPAWKDALSPEDTWALINHIKNFSPRFKNEPQGERIEVASVLESSPALVGRGKKLFKELKCIRCHGESLKGDGELAESLMDAWKHAVFVHDITNPHYFKSGHMPKDLFRTITAGLDGTPMGSYVHIPEEDRWALVHYIRSKFVKEFKKAEFETDIHSLPVGVELNTEPFSPVWEGVASTSLVLRPLSARREAVEFVNVASVNNGEQLAVRLQWNDPTHDAFSELHSDIFRDGAAVQFALGAVTLHTHGHNEPFFGMGNRNKPVNIWHWKAGLEEALEAEDDLEYAGGGVDMDALIYGGIMSNPVARLNATGENPVEELNAEGFGTVTPQPQENQNVDGSGEWKDGVWTVVFLRDMPKTGKWDVDFAKRIDPALMAFAIWDGVKEDRNGRKVISVWQRFNIKKPKP